MQVDRRAVRIELCRRFFWKYLQAKDPEFYTDDRWHLREFAEVLQAFWERKLIAPSGDVAKILVINLPPRMGKSYTLTNFCAWVLGRSKMEYERTKRARRDLGQSVNGIKQPDKIITVSYNDDMASDFSRYCRDNILAEKNHPDQIVFGDIFNYPVMEGMESVRISKGDGAAKKWALEGEFFSYLGAGFKGQITGKGASIGLIDDPIKNREEAYNENTLEYIWNFYKNTFRSRIENEGLQIINHTRWRSIDLAGRIIEMYGDDVYIHKRAIIKNPVRKEFDVVDEETGDFLYVEERIVDGELLCPGLCSWENFRDLEKTIDEDILCANYFQETLDQQGRLYSMFLTYPIGSELEGRISAYVDTADTGDDYLCMIIYVEVMRQAYVLDVYYTKAGMEVTEQECARRLTQFGVNYCKIESNSGGRGFARAVEKLLRLEYDNHKTIIDWFHQSKNKIARIHSNSAWVQKNVFWPLNWAKRWREFHRDLTGYQKEGKNKHDDAPDCLTGVAEQFQPAGGMPIFNPNTRPENARGYMQWQ